MVDRAVDVAVAIHFAHFGRDIAGLRRRLEEFRESDAERQRELLFPRGRS